MDDSSLILGNINFGSSSNEIAKNPRQNKAKKLAKFAQKPPKESPKKLSGKSPNSNQSNQQRITSKSTAKEHKNDAKEENSLNKSEFPSFKSSKLFDESTANIPEFSTVVKTVKHEELFSNKDFSEFEIDPMLVACLEQRFNLRKATKIQSLSIPIILNGDDVLIKSVTGSGKTLAYSIPLIQLLQSIQPKITRTDGLLALIILPTRELALQTYKCIDRLLNPYRRIVVGQLIGGEKKKSEKARIRKGLNILIATPGRLLDHLNRTRNLDISKLKYLIIDEADRLYEQGFAAIIAEIIECIRSRSNSSEESTENDRKIQTILLSATLSDGVKELAGLSLKNPKFIDVSDDDNDNSNGSNDTQQHLKEITLPSTLLNSFMIVPAKLRLITLFCIVFDSFFNENTGQNAENGQKMIIFTSCQDVVDFYTALFGEFFANHLQNNENNIEIYQLHGNMNQIERRNVFERFSAINSGMLICTDVCSRGIDMPDVNRIIQMSIPTTVEDFVHRCGRTARLGRHGQSILFVLPSEVKYIEYLQQELSINFETIRMEKYWKSIDSIELSSDDHLDHRNSMQTLQERLANLQHTLERIIWRHNELNQMARKAFVSYIRSYATYPRSLHQYITFRQLHFGHLAKSFALIEPPSELVNKLRTANRRSKAIDNSNMSQLKRKTIPLEQRISEFDSGFDSMDNKSVNSKKRSKRPRIS